MPHDGEEMNASTWGHHITWTLWDMRKNLRSSQKKKRLFDWDSNPCLYSWLPGKLFSESNWFLGAVKRGSPKIVSSISIQSLICFLDFWNLYPCLPSNKTFSKLLIWPWKTLLGMTWGDVKNPNLSLPLQRLPDRRQLVVIPDVSWWPGVLISLMVAGPFLGRNQALLLQ